MYIKITINYADHVIISFLIICVTEKTKAFFIYDKCSFGWGIFMEYQCEIVITIWEGISFPISNKDISN